MNRQDHELAAHDPWLRRLARRLARSRAGADDLVQDTYVTALRNAPAEVQMRPWLHAVMRRLAWGQVRSAERRVQREEGFSLTAPMVTWPDVLPEHGVDRERLDAAVAGLPEPYQATIVQRFFEGHSCAEIARRERIPAATVRWRQARGLELLREGLGPPRRRHAIWALPFLGVGGQIVARCWQVIVARLGGSKAVWLLLACAALLYAIVGTPAPHGLLAGPDARRDRVALGELSAPLAASLAQPGALPRVGRQTSLELAAAGTIGGALARGRSVAGVRSSHESWRDSLDHAIDSRRDDCVWDPVYGRVCIAAGGASSVALCALLHQQLAAGRALVLSSPTGRTMLASAMLASRARAQRLGCPLDDEDAGHANASGRPASSKPAAASKPPSDEPPPAEPPPAEPPPVSVPDAPPLELQPACTEEDDGHGHPCLACPGQPLACGETKCRSQEIATGIVCTLCVEEGGYTYADCPAPPSPTCHSEISPTGRVCSTCDGQPGPPECLPAQCSGTDNGCVRCVDPKDRSATDCSLDPGSWSASGDGADSTFGSCSISGGMTCNYPGNQSCVVNEYSDWHCMACLYRDGSGSGACMSASEALPDPFQDRPRNLPPPGHCVLEHGLGGVVTCATCTRADMSATRSCR